MTVDAGGAGRFSSIFSRQPPRHEASKTMRIRLRPGIGMRAALLLLLFVGLVSQIDVIEAATREEARAHLANSIGLMECKKSPARLRTGAIDLGRSNAFPRSVGVNIDNNNDNNNANADEEEDDDFGCASLIDADPIEYEDRELALATTAVSAATASTPLIDAAILKFFDVTNNCTFEFPLNSSYMVINGIPLLQFNLCNQQQTSENETHGNPNRSGAYLTELAFPLWVTVIVAALSLVISVVTVIGNVIVLISFVIERTLRQATNYFIASLAVSDLLIGLFSMNFYTLYIILDDEWVLGKVMCNLWLSLDYTVCLASQYTVFFITVDRFCSVKIPAKYRNWRTDNKVLAMVLVSWIIPSIIFFVSIMGWDHFTAAPPPDPLVKVSCVAGFQNNPLFNFLLTVFYFWLTLFIMCGLYVGIYRVALNMARKAEAKQKRLNTQLAGTAEPVPPVQVASATRSGGTAQSKQDNAPNAVAADQPNSSNTGNTDTFQSDMKRASLTSKRYSQLLADQATETSGYFDRPDETGLGVRLKAQSVPTAILSTTVALLHTAQLPEATTTTATSSCNLATRTTTITVAIEGVCETAQPVGDGDPVTSNGNSHEHATSSRCKCIKVQSGSGYYQSIDNEHERIDSGAYCDDLLSPTTFVLRRVSMQGTQRSNYSLVPSAISNGGSETTTMTATDTNTSTGNQMRVPGRRTLHDISEILPQLKDCNILVAADDNDEEMVRSPIWQRRPSFDETDRQAKPLLGNHVTVVTKSELETGGDKEDRRSSTLLKSTSEARERPHLSPRHSIPTSSNPLPIIAPIQRRKSLDEHNLIVLDHKASADLNDNPLGSANRRNNGDVLNTISGNSIVFDKAERHAISRALSVRVSAQVLGKKLVRSCVEFCSREKKGTQKSKYENRAKKAVKTITFILGAFVTCWTPYHIMVFISSFWPETAGSGIFNHFFRMSYWLCYLNSPINPFCYAFVNAQFKKTFLRILKCDLHVT